MTCRVCGYDFCWMCLGKWSDHNQSTGGYYKCNKFEEMKDTADYKEKNKASEDARQELNRYIFYFERYDNHFKAEKLIRKLKPVIELKSKMLHDIKKYPNDELEFLTVACEEIAKCR